MLPFCLHCLIASEGAVLNSHMSDVMPAEDEVMDPTDDIIRVVCDFMLWYMSVKIVSLDETRLDELFEDAGKVLQRLHVVLPERHLKAPPRHDPEEDSAGHDSNKENSPSQGASGDIGEDGLS